MKYLIIYLEIEHMLNFLSQTEKGDFLDLMIAYAKNQEDPVIENKNVLNVFNFIRGRLDTQFEKARVKAEVARKNGVGGGRPTDKKKPKKTQSKPKITQSVRPSLQEVSDYCQERKNSVNPEKWIAHYQSNGWKVGKNSMKDWKAAVRTWEGNSFESKSNTTQFLTPDQRRRQNNIDASMEFLRLTSGDENVG
jgi:hypothetical protein